MKHTKLIAGCLALALAAGVAAAHAPADVQAAKKKLSVNKVYNTTTKIKGKTKKKYTIKIKIGKKTYKSKASKKGNFSVKIPKQAAGKSFYVKVYKGKKYYTKKKVYVLAKTVSVKKFSKSSKYIKGYARPRYTVKVTMNGKTYQKKASKVKGYFSIKMKKAAGNSTATIKLYNTKKKYLKTYKKKAYNASSSSGPSSGGSNASEAEYIQDGKPYTGKMPGLKDPIDVQAFEKGASSTTKFNNNSIYHKTDVTKNYFNLFSGWGRGKLGYVVYYMSDSGDGEWQWYTAKNGVTLYYQTFKFGDLRNTPTPNPLKSETYQGKIESGQTKRFDPTYRDPDRNIAYLAIKIVGYKNGKPVMLKYTIEQLGAGHLVEE